MAERSSIAETKQRRQRVEREALRPAVRRFGSMGLGFAGGWAVLYGQLMPLGLGLTLGLPEEQFAACAAGAALGTLLRGVGGFSLRSICLLCALGGTVAMRWSGTRRYLPVMLSGCGLLVGAALCFAGAGNGGAGLVLYAAADAAAAAGIGWLMRRCPAGQPGFASLLAGAAVIAALAGVQWGWIPAGVAVCAALGLYLCCKGQTTGALAAQAVWGAALCAADPQLAPAATGLACGAAAAALLCPGQRTETAAAYLGGCLTGVLAIRPAGSAFGTLFAICGGVGLVLLLPRQMLTPAPVAVPQQTVEPPRPSIAATRLEAVAQSLDSLAQTVNEVYKTLPHRCENFRWVIDNTHDTLCANCGRREQCWQQEYTVTMEGMEALRPLLEQDGNLEVTRLPGQLSRCIHPAALCSCATRSFALYRSRKEAQIHAEAMRTALTEQYSAMAQALEALGQQLGRPGRPEPYRTGRVAEFFASVGLRPLECAVTQDELGRTHAAVTLRRTRFSQKELSGLSQEVGRICRRSLELPQVLSCQEQTTLLFAEVPALRAAFGMAATAAQGSISGDAVRQFSSPYTAWMILCDGMGTGRAAAVDGSLAAELTARLLRTGIPAELAARLVNVALALKSEEESGATLDLVSVDLYTGTARLFKAGAAPGFLVQNGRARAVGDITLPMGILGGVNGQSRVAHLAAGDYVVLVSDGLLVDGPGWVTAQLELSAAGGDPPEKLARLLVETAHARAQKSGRPDDITAAVLRLEKYD